MRMWMVRNQNDVCSRPLLESVLKARIESGEIGPGDEICPSGGYWFPIGDSEELRKFLGEVRLPGESRSVSVAGPVDVTREVEGRGKKGAPQKRFWALLFFIFWAVFAILWMSSRSQ